VRIACGVSVVKLLSCFRALCFCFFFFGDKRPGPLSLLLFSVLFSLDVSSDQVPDGLGRGGWVNGP